MKNKTEKIIDLTVGELREAIEFAKEKIEERHRWLKNHKGLDKGKIEEDTKEWGATFSGIRKNNPIENIIINSLKSKQ